MAITADDIRDLIEHTRAKSERWLIRFRGRRWLFVGDKEGLNGAITTKSRFENFEVSVAHLYPHMVSRFGFKVGEASEVRFLKKLDRRSLRCAGIGP